MSEFKLNIHTNNSAFDGDADSEIARLLREAADSIELGGVGRHTRSLVDYNGNRVGGYKLEDN